MLINWSLVPPKFRVESETNMVGFLLDHNFAGNRDSSFKLNKRLNLINEIIFTMICHQ